MLDTATQEVSKLCRTEEEMNKQRIEHCNRCHNPIHSRGGHYDTQKAYFIYDIPKECTVCRNEDWADDPSEMNGLPNEKNGILCKCTHPECGKVFYSRPSWINRQRSIAKTTGNPWMPEVLETDPEKIKLINPNNEDSESAHLELTTQ